MKPHYLKLAERIGLVAAGYVGAPKLGLLFAFGPPQVTPALLATGIALIVLLLFGKGLWPGVPLGAFLAHVPTAESLGVALGLAEVPAAAGRGEPGVENQIGGCL